MIFVDLDECLIRHELNSAYWMTPSPKVEMYSFHLRPGALSLLEKLRKIAPTKMLTAGSLTHATESNIRHELGYGPGEILSREDFCNFTQYAVGAKAKDHCPGSILIDNNPACYEFTRAKLEFLGIGEDRLIVVPHFTGEPDLFIKMIPNVIRRVKKLLKKPS